MKISKSNIFYMITSYFLMFAFIGALFNVFKMAMAWSVSIFIILWCAYWFGRYCIDMYYYMDAMMQQIKEDVKNFVSNETNNKSEEDNG